LREILKEYKVRKGFLIFLKYFAKPFRLCVKSLKNTKCAKGS
jgi:hypothetical protein